MRAESSALRTPVRVPGSNLPEKSYREPAAKHRFSPSPAPKLLARPSVRRIPRFHQPPSPITAFTCAIGGMLSKHTSRNWERRAKLSHNNSHVTAPQILDSGRLRGGAYFCLFYLLLQQPANCTCDHSLFTPPFSMGRLPHSWPDAYADPEACACHGIRRVQHYGISRRPCGTLGLETPMGCSDVSYCDRIRGTRRVASILCAPARGEISRRLA